MENEGVSVVVPTFNRAYLIKRSIDSVLKQTYKNFEILIIDDGSTDNTYDVVSTIGDDRIKYIRYSSNQGAAYARNEGIKLSKYDYIAFQDSDDVWNADKLEKQMKMILESDANMGLVYCEYHYNGLNGIEGICPNRDISLSQKSGNKFPYLLTGNMIGTPTMLVRKEVFEKVGGFDESYSCLEDYEFALRVASMYKIGFVPECLMEVYATNESVTNNPVENLHMQWRLMNTYKMDMIRYGIWDIIVNGLKEKAEELGIVDRLEI